MFVHVEVNEVSVINVDDPCNVACQLCDWAEKVGAMTLLLVRFDDVNADDCPACRGRPVPMAKSLSFDFQLEVGRRISSPGW